MAENPSFALPASTNAGALPKGFGAWQNEKEPTGKFAWDGQVGGGSAQASKVKHGCLIQAHAARPGETYVITAQCVSRGHSSPTLLIRWQTAKERWTDESEDQTFTFNNPADQWQEAWGVATVPSGAGRIVILLNVTGQTSDEDVCWFDNLALYRVR